jgi:3-methylfumaryl-CoA hydratase
MSTRYAAWIDITEQKQEVISLAQVQAAAATLDDSSTEFAGGAALPPLWQWFFFLPRAPQSQLDVDGHPRRGGFMPPIELPRRMFAGARMRFVRPLIVGKPATRNARICEVTEKEGRSGKLAFVKVSYTLLQGGEICIEEEQDIVYREQGDPVEAPKSVEFPPAPEGSWTRIIKPDPTLLFRFSALTFNAHRIHYDRDYAIGEEGYPGLVVHGPLTAVLLMELIRFNSVRRVRKFSFRGQSPLFDLAPFRLVAEPRGDNVALEAQGPDGRTAMSAEAELA